MAVKSRTREKRSARIAASGSWISFAGHPSLKQLMADQGTGPITDVSLLRGDFWPEEESMEEFLEALHEWRGHKRTDPAA